MRLYPISWPRSCSRKPTRFWAKQERTSRDEPVVWLRMIPVQRVLSVAPRHLLIALGSADEVVWTGP